MTQPLTEMGRALSLPGSNPVLQAHPKLTFAKGGYTYTIETNAGHSTYTVSDGTRTISLPILWSFGAGAQTWVLQRGDQLYESLVSYYPAIHGLDITTGDERMTPNTLDAAMGRPMTQQNAKACFGCHTTGAISQDKLDFQSMKPGVGCEHCHLGANQHMADIFEGQEDSIPPDLSKLTSGHISDFCGQCHRTWELVVRSRWQGEATVRFQPYRLENSKCFNATDSRIGCIACHNPHQQVVRKASFYDAKCLACHSPSMHRASVPSANRSKSCPVAKSNCVSCHMPKVNMLGGHLTFTDHDIRIVKPGEPYPN
ncbi:multiheme c-type cytochrome [Edaphobacter paludis]|uniref:Multiheme c-type cytochrome n=1 Tax=Edaphobacter paludis TaxID=3035702 RepID=A0AAU7CVR8_9BACT